MRAVPLLALAAAAHAAPPTGFADVTWLSPSDFTGKHYEDAMPTGNGRIAALAWGNATSGGLDAYIRSADALHIDSQVYTLARLSVHLAPNPCYAGAYYNQTLHLADGSITLLCGGTSLADYTAALTLFVDAHADAVLVTAASRDGATPFSLTASLTTVRPAARFEYALNFQCFVSSSGPDTLLPAPLPAPAPPASVGLYHANSAARGDVSLFNSSMHIQGLAPLLSTFNDTLDGRIFGAGMVGGSDLPCACCRP